MKDIESLEQLEILYFNLISPFKDLETNMESWEVGSKIESYNGVIKTINNLKRSYSNELFFEHSEFTFPEFKDEIVNFFKSSRSIKRLEKEIFNLSNLIIDFNGKITDDLPITQRIIAWKRSKLIVSQSYMGRKIRGQNPLNIHNILMEFIGIRLLAAEIENEGNPTQSDAGINIDQIQYLINEISNKIKEDTSIINPTRSGTKFEIDKIHSIIPRIHEIGKNNIFEADPVTFLTALIYADLSEIKILKIQKMQFIIYRLSKFMENEWYKTILLNSTWSKDDCNGHETKMKVQLDGKKLIKLFNDNKKVLN